jgi:hypothetical protein
MCGAIPPLPHTFSCLGEWLSIGYVFLAWRAEGQLLHSFIQGRLVSEFEACYVIEGSLDKLWNAGLPAVPEAEMASRMNGSFDK